MTTATRQVWCGTCGRKARHVTDSLDPAHPVVSCSYVTPYNDNAGCHRVIGTYSRAEAEAASEARRLAAIVRRHSYHVKDDNPRPDCRKCQGGPIRLPRPDHDYAPAATRLSVIAHLETKHYRGAIPHDYDGVDMEAITMHHRSLHS